jgi:hypothetical protein
MLRNICIDTSTKDSFNTNGSVDTDLNEAGQLPIFLMNFYQVIRFWIWKFNNKQMPSRKQISGRAFFLRESSLKTTFSQQLFLLCYGAFYALF